MHKRPPCSLSSEYVVGIISDVETTFWENWHNGFPIVLLQTLELTRISAQPTLSQTYCLMRPLFALRICIIMRPYWKNKVKG